MGDLQYFGKPEINLTLLGIGVGFKMTNWCVCVRVRTSVYADIDIGNAEMNIQELKRKSPGLHPSPSASRLTSIRCKLSRQ